MSAVTGRSRPEIAAATLDETVVNLGTKEILQEALADHGGASACA